MSSHAERLTSLQADTHEAVRTYLAVIRSHAELLLAYPETDPERITALEGIRQAAIAATQRLTARAGITILVVDDEPQIHQLVRRLLAPRGFTLADAQNAENALALVGSVRPSVVICDVHMPGRDGLWLAEQIREQFPATAIVFSTGDSRISPRATLRKGVVGYLVKPFGGDALLAAVDEGVRWSAEARARTAG